MRHLFAGAITAVFLIVTVATVGRAQERDADLAANASDEAAVAAAETEEEDEYGDLVLAGGAEETFYACTACHSEKIVVQQGMSRERWDTLLEWMVEEQGMSEIEPDERQIILDYLATHYNEDRPNYPGRGQ